MAMSFETFFKKIDICDMKLIFELRMKLSIDIINPLGRAVNIRK